MTDQQQFDELKASISNIGWFRRGTIVERYTRCGKPGCRCQADPPKLHGPYHQWSTKIDGKTKTIRLSPEQLELMQTWTDNARQLHAIIDQMEQIAYQHTEQLLQTARTT